MERNPDVVIVGLGPVGGVLAALCSLRGLNVVVVERDTDVYRLPRAVAMDHEVLRQVGMIGVADDVLAASNPSEGYEFVNSEREILVARYQSGLAPTGYPFANLFHQPSFETSVRARLTKLPNVSVLLGSEVVELQQDTNKVVATVRTPDGSLRINSRYVVGCDGAKSFVRRWIRSPMRDLGFDEPWLVVDVRLPGGMEALSNKGMQLCDPRQPTTSTQSGPGRHRWEFMLMPGDNPEEMTQEESIKERLASWIDPDTVTIERSAVYRFHGLIAEHWRKDRVMIIGDAAHQMPPFLGQGMCSGLRDAFNLAWKLESVLSNTASDSLLDTVCDERSPHVEAITEAAIQLGKLVCVTDSVKAAARDKQFKADHDAGRPPPFPPMPRMRNGILNDDVAGRVMPEPFVVTDDSVESVRLDEVVGYVPVLVLSRDFELSAENEAVIDSLCEACPTLRVAQAGATNPRIIDLVDVDERLQTLLGNQEALLVKPDRIVFGCGDIATLADAWTDYLGGTAFAKKVA